MAPSPSVFLAAVAQRTKRLRFGPMVYALPLYHPLRMIEEICMLDQMSRGRLDIGFGRGSSPIELAISSARISRGAGEICRGARSDHPGPDASGQSISRASITTSTTLPLALRDAAKALSADLVRRACRRQRRARGEARLAGDRARPGPADQGLLRPLQGRVAATPSRASRCR